MFKNYFKTALRNFSHHKGYTLLNVMGLAIGIAASLLILEYSSHELSYDNFHENKDQLYRVQYNSYRKSGELQYKCATAFPGVGPAMKADFPEVEDFCRLFLRYGGEVVQFEDKVFHENDLFQADQSFFSLFDYELLEGDRLSALENPNTAVIEEETAKKYFGDESPIGKRIKVAGSEDYEITGILRSPENSHLKFTMLLSYKTLYQWGDPDADPPMREVLETNWGWYDFYNYVLLAPDTDPRSLEAKFPEFIDKHTREGGNERTKFELQKISDIHLHSDLIQEARTNGNAQTTYSLLTIAFFILIIAWINYINLATARSLKRAQEVGIRKVVGAQKSQLIRQFLFESLLLNFLATCLAILLLEFAIPLFNNLSGTDLSTNLYGNPLFWVALVSIFLLGSFLAGLYPAFVLSSYKPISVLKGTFTKSSTGILIRKLLVVGQFAISVILIAGTIVVYQQIQFMQNQDLGIDIEQTLVIEGPGAIANDTLADQTSGVYKDLLRKHPEISMVAGSSDIPGNLIYWTNGGQLVGGPEGGGTILYKVGVDYEYLNTMGHQFLAGRNFSKEFGTDEKGIILNETTMGILGISSPEEALTHRVATGGDSLRIVGVVADFHQQGLKHDHRPIVFLLQPNSMNYVSLKVNSQNLENTIAFVEGEYQNAFPGNPFNYFFLDKFYNRQYKTETQFGKVFGLFALLAILVASLGLIGLSAFSAAQRTKEIGVRKVMGATTSRIFALLSKDFLKWVLVGNVIAIPVVMFFMNRWLEGFAFRIEISWWIFACAGLVTLAIAMLTVSYQSLKAAHSNPVDSLRNE